jgi:hypothetical protein
MEDQLLPSKWKILPPAPTAKTSLEELPHTPRKRCPLANGIAIQFLPSKCRMVLSEPTAKTSFAELPHTPQRSEDVPLCMPVHSLPLYLRIVPFLPTANASSGELPHTAIRSGRKGCCNCHPAVAPSENVSNTSKKLSRAQCDARLIIHIPLEWKS